MGVRLDRAVLAKVLSGLSNLDLMGRAADPGAPRTERAAAVAELSKVRGEEVVADLLTLAEADESIREEILFHLGRRGVQDVRQPLLDFLSTAREPWNAAMAAEILERFFHDDAGLRWFQGDLGSLDETEFLRAWSLYRAVEPRRRGERYLAWVGRALDRQVHASYVAALLHLLRHTAPIPALGEVVVPWLPDRRQVRVPVVGRRGRVGDLAADCLLGWSGIPRPRTLLGRLRYRRLRRWVRDRVRTVEDWRELVDRGELHSRRSPMWNAGSSSRAKPPR